MSKNRSPKNSKIIPLFITFAILFIVVFALGVIIGKGLGGSDSGTIEKSYDAEAPVIEYGAPEIVEEETESEEVIIIDEADTDMDDDNEAVSDSADSESKETETTEVSAPAITPDKEMASATSEPEKKEEVEEKEPAKAVVEKTPPPTKKPTESAAMPRIDPSGRYTVQIGAFQNQTEANKLVNSLKSSGYPAFIKQLQTPDKKNWYRVRVGTFSTRQDAVVYGEKLKQSETKVKTVFITVNN